MKREPSGGSADHLKESISEYQKAIELATGQVDKTLAYLGLGWIVEQSGDIERALDAYRKCYSVGRDQPSDDPDGRWGPGIEAGNAIVRILISRAAPGSKDARN
jgi:hypothetical protein